MNILCVKSPPSKEIDDIINKFNIHDEYSENKLQGYGICIFLNSFPESPYCRFRCSSVLNSSFFSYFKDSNFWDYSGNRYFLETFDSLKIKLKKYNKYGFL